MPMQPTKTVNVLLVWPDATTTHAQADTPNQAMAEAKRWAGDPFYCRGRRPYMLFLGCYDDTAPVCYRWEYRMGQGSWKLAQPVIL